MLLRYALLLGITIVIARPAFGAADKSETTPDFCQTDRDGEFDNGGRTFCGPVAVSNSIMWFGQNGFPKLIDGKVQAKEAQIELIRTLASPDYMHTTTEGTGAKLLMEGAAKYVGEHGQKFAQLEYRGWRPLKKELKPSQNLPSLDWIAPAVENPRGGASVNVGWYTRDDATDVFTRHGGHWMTATAADPSPSASTIDLHDPAPRSGKGNITHHSHVELLKSGTLAGTETRRPADATGLFVVRDGIVPKEVVKGEKTYPIIDGVVVMVLE